MRTFFASVAFSVFRRCVVAAAASWIAAGGYTGEKTRDYNLPLAEMSYPDAREGQRDEVTTDPGCHQQGHVCRPLQAAGSQPLVNGRLQIKDDRHQGCIRKRQLRQKTWPAA